YCIFAFFLMVADLGSALTSVGPMLAAIQSSLGLAGVAADLVLALTLLIFAGFSRAKALGSFNSTTLEQTKLICLRAPLRWLEVFGRELRLAHVEPEPVASLLEPSADHPRVG